MIQGVMHTFINYYLIKNWEVIWENNSSASLSVEEQKEVLGNLTDENIKEVIPNSHGEKNVQEILNSLLTSMNQQIQRSIITE